MDGYNFKDNIKQQEKRIYLWQDPQGQRYVFALACATSSSVYYSNIDADCRRESKKVNWGQIVENFKYLAKYYV